jgi:hypothetical protein
MFADVPDRDLCADAAQVLWRVLQLRPPRDGLYDLEGGPPQLVAVTCKDERRLVWTPAARSIIRFHVWGVSEMPAV